MFFVTRSDPLKNIDSLVSYFVFFDNFIEAFIKRVDSGFIDNCPALVK